MATKEPNDNAMLPWMPYIYALIFGIALGGFYILFSEKEISAEHAAPAKIFPEQIVEPVKHLLEDIRGKKLKEAYQMGSSDFKISISFDHFVDFINQYDSLNQWSEATFSAPQIEGEMASVVAYLHFENQEGTLPISFSLIHEEGQWKVYAFVLSREDLNVPLKQIGSLKELIKAVNLQLSYLSKKNPMSAYYKMSTKRFQKETSYDSFLNFLKETPIFYHQMGATLFDGKIDGEKGNLKVSLYSEEETVPMEFYLAKEEGKWKIDKIELLTAQSTQRPLEKKEVEESIQVVELFLKNLRENLPEKAYNIFASKGFQKSTSLEVFEAFVKDHPILTETLQPRFIEAGKEGKERILYLIYHNSSFEVTLTKEAGGWKIQSMTLESPEEAIPSESLDKGVVLDLIQPILTTLYEGNFALFYDKETSKGFRRHTSYEAFITHLNLHPILKSNPKPFLEEWVQDRDQLKVETNLVGEGHSYSTLFFFVFENGKWKLQRVESKAEKTAPHHSLLGGVELSQILVGQDIDDAGMIHDSGTPLTRPHDPIYVTLFLTSTTPDGSLELYLSHDESQSKTAPIRGSVDDEGHNIITFTFSPPPEGWPAGHYKASAIPQSGGALDAPFVLETQPSY